MNCPRHPNKRAVASCGDCGADFCIECVRETDQTGYCYDCFRRKINGMAREFAEPVQKEEPERASVLDAMRPSPYETPAPEAEARPAEPAAPERPPAAGRAAVSEGVPTAPAGKARIGLRRDSSARKKPSRKADPRREGRDEDFLAQGPDEDFSMLSGERGGRMARRLRSARPMAEGDGAPAAEVRSKAAPAEAPAPTEPGAHGTKQAAASEDSLLDDVVSTLLRPQEDTGTPAPAAAEAPAEEVPAVEGGAGEAVAAKAAGREEAADRWAFLAQPRAKEHTILATSWWRSALFIALMLLTGIVLWAAPNAFLFPGEKEYGIHAILVGIVLGILFWWKAGKKHGTKLAVQAALTTFFALALGEFVHWTLEIVKNDALRTIFFDLVSFKFLWENGAEIMKHTIEAMFPAAFLWILVLPGLSAFIIGFGMPPVPEIFFQFGRAIRGLPPREKEAGGGLEG